MIEPKEGDMKREFFVDKNRTAFLRFMDGKWTEVSVKEYFSKGDNDAPKSAARRIDPYFGCGA